MKMQIILRVWLFAVGIPVLGNMPPFPVNPKVIEAIKKHDVKRVKEMLDKGVDFNVYDDSEGSALTIAISLDYEDIVNLMLQHKVSVAPEWDRTGPVDTAIKTGNLKILKNLAEAKADLNDIGYDHTPLMLAIQNKRMDCIRFLVENGVDIEKEDPLGRTALNEACFCNYFEAVEYLVEKGADFRHRDGRGQDENTLTYAANVGNLGLLKKLMQKGADIFEVSPKRKKVLLHYAAWKYLNHYKHYGEIVPIPEKISMIRFLVSKGLRINAQDILGDTPLIMAVRANYIEIAKTLLELGADKTIKNKEGKSALDYAETEVKDPILIQVLTDSVSKGGKCGKVSDTSKP